MNRNPEPVADDAPTEEKTAAEVYKSLHAKVKVIRDRRGLSIAEVFQKYGAPGIECEYRRVVGEMNAEIGGES